MQIRMLWICRILVSQRSWPSWSLWLWLLLALWVHFAWAGENNTQPIAAWHSKAQSIGGSLLILVMCCVQHRSNGPHIGRARVDYCTHQHLLSDSKLDNPKCSFSTPALCTFAVLSMHPHFSIQLTRWCIWGRYSVWSGQCGGCFVARKGTCFVLAGLTHTGPHKYISARAQFPIFLAMVTVLGHTVVSLLCLLDMWTKVLYNCTNIQSQ